MMRRIEKRRHKIIELHCKGLTIPEIVDELRASGQPVSERTVWSDLHSETAQDYVSPSALELIRAQMKEIREQEKSGLRLKYRDRLIGRILPRREIIKQEIKDMRVTDEQNNIRDFTSEEREEIRKAGRILLSKRLGTTGPADI